MVKQLTCSTITPEERTRRQAAVNTARASVGLEGFKLSREEEVRAQQYVDGKMTLQEFVGRSIAPNTESNLP